MQRRVSVLDVVASAHMRYSNVASAYTAITRPLCVERLVVNDVHVAQHK